MTTETQTEYSNLPLANLNESANNPRRTFDPAALNELADFVPGNKICQFFQSPFVKTAARVGG
jgi:hypothetical protein